MYLSVVVPCFNEEASIPALVSRLDAAIAPWREQAQIIGLLVSRIEFDAHDSSVAVCFHASAIKTLAERAVGEAA